MKGPNPVNKHEAEASFPKIFIIYLPLKGLACNQVKSAACTKAQIIILVSRQSFDQRAWLKKTPRHVSTLVAGFLTCARRI